MALNVCVLVPGPPEVSAKGIAKVLRHSTVLSKRGSDANSRIFFGELVSVGVSRLIRLEDRQAGIPFEEQNKLIDVAHTVFRNAGSWSNFSLPECGARSKELWLVDDTPRCRHCLEKLGVRYRAAYGFGRTTRLRERDRRIDRLQTMLEGGPWASNLCRLKLGNRHLDRRNRLTVALQRARIVARLV